MFYRAFCGCVAASLPLIAGSAGLAAPPRKAPVKSGGTAGSAPFTYGPWRSCQIGGGGYVQNVVLSSDPKRLYAYIDVGGVYRSDDGGKRWRMVHDDLPLRAVRSLLVDPRDPNRLLIAVGNQWDGVNRGLFESRNGGEDWKLVHRGYFYGNEDYRSAGLVLARNPRNPDHILAHSGKEGIVLSRDGGTTWTRTGGAPGTFATSLAFDRDGKTVWLCAKPSKLWNDGQMAGGYFRSTDGGATWQKVADDGPYEVNQDSRTANRWYSLWNEQPQVRVSDDGGKTWQAFMDGLPTPGKGEGIDDTWYDAFGVGPGFVLLGGKRGSVFRRAAGADKWERVAYKQVTENYEGRPWHARMGPGRYQHFGSAMASLIVDPRNPKSWWFTDWYAIYHSPDAGNTWNLSMDGLEDTVLHTLVQDPTDPGFVHLGMADNGYLYSVEGGAFFEAAHINSNMKCVSVNPKLPARVYGVGDPGNGQWKSNTVYVSIDRSKSWTRSPMTGLPNPDEHNRNTIAVDPRDPYTVYVAVAGEIAEGKGGLYRSKDGGKSWTWYGQGLPLGKGGFHSDIWHIGREFAVDSSGAMVAALRDTGQLYRRAPGDAATWEEVPAASLGGGIGANDVVVDPKTPGHFLLAGGGAGVWQTRDGGKTWKKILAADSAHLAFDEAKPNRIAAGTKDGPMLSEDGGKTWRALDKRLPAKTQNQVAFAGDRLIVGTDGCGAFWMPLTPAAAKPIAARPVPPAPVRTAAKPPAFSIAGGLFDATVEAGSDAAPGWRLMYVDPNSTAKTAVDRKTVAQGTGALRFDVSANGYASAGQSVLVDAGGAATRLRGRVRTTAGNNEALAAVQCFDAQGKQIGWITLADAKAKPDEWLTFDQKLNLPSGTAMLNVLVTLKPGDKPGSIFLDDVTTVMETQGGVFPE